MDGSQKTESSEESSTLKLEISETNFYIEDLIFIDYEFEHKDIELVSREYKYDEVHAIWVRIPDFDFKVDGF